MEMDDLRIVWVNESFIDMSYSKVVMPKIQDESRRVSTRKRSRQRVQVTSVLKGKGEPFPIKTDIPFWT